MGRGDGYKKGCPYDHGDCFAKLINGGCFCLTDKYGWFPKDQDCPFYKPPTRVSPNVMLEIDEVNYKISRRKRLTE